MAASVLILHLPSVHLLTIEWGHKQLLTIIFSATLFFLKWIFSHRWNHLNHLSQCENIFLPHEKNDFDSKLILLLQIWLYLITLFILLFYFFSVMSIYCAYPTIVIFRSRYWLLSVFSVLYDFMVIWLLLDPLYIMGQIIISPFFNQKYLFSESYLVFWKDA